MKQIVEFQLKASGNPTCNYEQQSKELYVVIAHSRAPLPIIGSKCKVSQDTIVFTDNWMGVIHVC